MPSDDRLKKVSGAGADFLETARTKAEEFLRELARAGEGTSKQAQEVLDDIVGEGRKSTEQFVTAVRKEVGNQLRSLGLATKGDLADLEQRLTAQIDALSAKAPVKAPVATAGSTARRTAAKATADSVRTTADKTADATADAPAKKATKKAAAAKKTAG